MNTKHTKEPWSINDWPQDTADITIGTILTPLIAKVSLRNVSINEQKANARRIVACINACEGFSTEKLEDANLFNDSIESQNEIIELKKRRDELIAQVEQFQCQLAGCTVAAIQNTRHSAAQRAVPGGITVTPPYDEMIKVSNIPKKVKRLLQSVGGVK